MTSKLCEARATQNMSHNSEIFSELSLSEFKKKLEAAGCQLTPEQVAPGSSERPLRAQKFSPTRIFFFSDIDEGFPVPWNSIANACTELDLNPVEFGITP
jgi:hypothetical protein